jgi:hypothetical protein
MKSNKYIGALRVAGLLSLLSVGSYVWAQQGPQFGPPRGGGFGPPPGGGFEEEENAEPLPPPRVTLEERDGFRYMTSNGIPNHVTGQFPNRGNPSRISAQDYKFRMPLEPVVAEKTTLVRHNKFGVGVNGIPFDAATNEFWNNNRAWNYDALSGKINLGTDSSNAHVQPGGLYHYHGLPHEFIKILAKKDTMTMLGYAADGFPIYATHAHETATDLKSAVKKMRSSYRLKEGTRPQGTEGPGGTYDGTFSADWEYVEGAGDLDDCNGRTGVTPEYPQGTYYYVITDEFPFVPRYYRGTPDSSFGRARGAGQSGQGRQGGPGGQQGGQGRQEGRGGPGAEGRPEGRGGPRGRGGPEGGGGRRRPGPPPPGFGPPQ